MGGNAKRRFNSLKPRPADTSETGPRLRKILIRARIDTRIKKSRTLQDKISKRTLKLEQESYAGTDGGELFSEKTKGDETELMEVKQTLMQRS